MADTGSSRTASSPEDPEFTKKVCDIIVQFNSESDRSGPQKDKKTPLKKKKEPNRKREALKKKAAETKAKHLKTQKDLKEYDILEKIKKANIRLEKRKSLMEEEQKRIKTFEEKLRQLTDQ